ncbi:nuclear transport factor 2 family protein [Nocardioides solisilvae]|uniref:nuclear transport factor 2 family protein n=1 Tax=Nocardioides solisilvae TaxID=1542435 RepID=UPI000D74BE04|nr:nuclear transport factor 2 family protein [Nocardioides solisilvae]
MSSSQPRTDTARAFRAAVEARDPEAMTALLAEDVVFRSPVAHKPYPGRAITASILTEVVDVFSDFVYVTEIGGDGARDHALVFEARVGDKQLTGCDFLHLDDDGLIDEFMVMVRPLSGAQALADEMASRFDRIVARAAGQESGDQAAG